MNEKMEYKITFKSFFGHLHTVNKHRFKVFCLCVKAGIPWRGFVHDLSKYSPVEFLEGAKYYTGGYSPIMNCKKDKGYSLAWLHHFGRNKHHYEYWYDHKSPEPCPIMPYKYVVEMICDSLAAGMVYQGKNWTSDYQLHYWLKVREGANINSKLDVLLTKVYTEVSKEGIDKVLNKDNLKKLYDRYTR